MRQPITLDAVDLTIGAVNAAVAVHLYLCHEHGINPNQTGALTKIATELDVTPTHYRAAVKNHMNRPRGPRVDTVLGWCGPQGLTLICRQTKDGARYWCRRIDNNARDAVLSLRRGAPRAGTGGLIACCKPVGPVRTTHDGDWSVSTNPACPLPPDHDGPCAVALAAGEGEIDE